MAQTSDNKISDTNGSNASTSRDREMAIREILQVISKSRADATPVFRTVLENAARLCKAEHSLLLLRDANDTHLELVANNSARSRFVDFIRENPHDLRNSGSLAVQALLDGRTLMIDDLLKESQSNASDQFTVALEVEQMRSLLIVPLMQNGQSLGVICLYKLRVEPFIRDEAELVEAFAEHAVIAIENARQFRALEERTREVQLLNDSLKARVDAQVGELERIGRLKRFLSPAVVEAVVSEGEGILSSHRALIAVLFCDIRGFTAFCETAEPEETIEVLQTYHEEMGNLISGHGGGVDKRMGDGIMVILNDPIPVDDPAVTAVRLAVAMRERMEVLCKNWKRLGHRLGFGVGVSLGYATVGMVGSEGRYDYTASGTAVNLAARLCDKARDGEILLSTRAQIAVEDAFPTELVGEMELKGMREAVEVFRLS